MHKGLLFVLLFLPGLWAVAVVTPLPDSPQGEDALILVRASGDTSATTLMQSLMSSYFYNRDYVTMEYSGEPSLVAITQTFAVDFNVFISPIASVFTTYYNITQFPLFGKSLVMAYNLPELASSNSSVLLDRETLAQIYLGQVQYWNDSKIQALNPNVSDLLPFQLIQVGYTIDSTVSSAQIMGASMASFSPAYQAFWNASLATGEIVYNISNVSPDHSTYLSSVSSVRMNWTVSTPYALTYIDYSDYIDVYGLNNVGAVRWMPMYNKAGFLVYPYAANVQSAMSDFKDAYEEDQLTLQIIDGPGNNSWPLSYVIFLAVGTPHEIYCSRTSEVLRFSAWALTNSGAAFLAQSVNSVALDATIKGRVLDRLQNVECNNELAYASEFLLGYGPPLSIMLSWVDLWSSTATTSKYFASSSAEALSLQATYSSDYGTTITGVNSTIADLGAMPLAVFAIVPAYNVLAFSQAANSLAFSPELLANIYMGVVVNWNDNSILGLNPDLAPLPDEPIVVLIQNYPSDYNLILTTYLSQTVPAFAASVGISNQPDFSQLFANNNNTILVEEVFGIYDVMTVTEGSFALWPQFGIGLTTRETNVRVGNLAQMNGGSLTLLTANSQSMTEAVQTHLDILGLPQGIQASSPLQTGASTTAWPLTAFITLLYRSSSTTQLSKAQALADFLYWTQSDSNAAISAQNSQILLASTVDPRLEEQFFLLLANYTSNGTQASSLAGCINEETATLCSNEGLCSGGKCICNSSFSGQYCQNAVTSSGTDLALIIPLSIILPLFFFCLPILLLIVLLLILLRSSYRRGAPNNWEIDLDEVTIADELGQGAFGKVYRAQFKGADVAVKLIKTSPGWNNREGEKAFRAEVAVMADLRHPNVVLFMAACTRPPTMCIVMEYMALGSLYDLLHNELVPKVPLELVYRLGYQAAKGMHFLHSSGIVHRDLKSLNLLLDSKWQLKVSDFGLTKFKKDLADSPAVIGTVHWTAPEVLAESPDIDYMLSDVYSFAIVMWELVSRQEPYEGLSPAAVAVRVIRDQARPQFQDYMDCPDEYKELVYSAWHHDPMIRPPFLEIMTRLDNLSHGGESGSFRRGTTSGDNISFPYSSQRSSSTETGTHLASDTSTEEISPPQLAVPDAPLGEVAIVITDIWEAGTLWSEIPMAMRDAVILHNQLLRQSLGKGYEAALPDNISTEGSFCLAFSTIKEALDYSIQTQTSLLNLPWPEELLKSKAAGEEWNINDNQKLYSGLRVRMSIGFGRPEISRDALTRRARYQGPFIDDILKGAALAKGGQVLLTRSALLALDEDGPYQTRQIKKTGFFELIVPSLEERFFDQASSSQSALKPGESNGDSSTEDLFTTGKTRDMLASANTCNWIISYPEILLGEQIGSGSYGIVYKGRWKGMDVAVKKLVRQKMDESHMLQLRAEAGLMFGLSHPNIVLFIGASLLRPNICLVTELVPKGNLKELLSSSQRISWEKKIWLLLTAAQGVEYLHGLEPAILHRDLKPSNMLVDENGSIKIADFGLARIKQDNVTMTRCGTPCWTAPEILKGEKYDEKADVYSFAIIIWQVLTRKEPYAGENYMNVSLKVLEGTRPTIPPGCSESLKKLMKRSWKANPLLRPTMSQVRQALEGESHSQGEEV